MPDPSLTFQTSPAGLSLYQGGLQKMTLFFFSKHVPLERMSMTMWAECGWTGLTGTGGCLFGVCGSAWGGGQGDRADTARAAVTGRGQPAATVLLWPPGAAGRELQLPLATKLARPRLHLPAGQPRRGAFFAALF